MKFEIGQEVYALSLLKDSSAPFDHVWLRLGIEKAKILFLKKGPLGNLYEIKTSDGPFTSLRYEKDIYYCEREAEDALFEKEFERMKLEQ